MTEKIEKLFELARAVNGYDGSLDILDFYDIEEMGEICHISKETPLTYWPDRFYYGNHDEYGNATHFRFNGYGNFDFLFK